MARPSTHEDDEWRDLAVLAQGGDKVAYNKLLRAISPYIHNRIAPTLANIDWADDVTQEVLISVHKSLHTYSPDRPFRPWLSAIIGFRRTDFLRKHYSKRENAKTSLDNPDFLTSHVTKPSHAGEYKDIEQALSGLPQQQSDVFTKIKLEGYTAKEVANEMGMSVSAVKVSAHRTMKKLQNILK